jgi:hypothetical protein
VPGLDLPLGRNRNIVGHRAGDSMARVLSEVDVAVGAADSPLHNAIPVLIGHMVAKQGRGQSVHVVHHRRPAPVGPQRGDELVDLEVAEVQRHQVVAVQVDPVGQGGGSEHPLQWPESLLGSVVGDLGGAAPVDGDTVVAQAGCEDIEVGRQAAARVIRAEDPHARIPYATTVSSRSVR